MCSLAVSAESFLVLSTDKAEENCVSARRNALVRIYDELRITLFIRKENEMLEALKKMNDPTVGLLSSIFNSKNKQFKSVEDIYLEDQETVGPDGQWWEVNIWYLWPGPKETMAAPQKISRRLGIRVIPFDKTISIEKAFDIAWKRLMETNCGSYFVGEITLYWPLTPACPAPAYHFQTDIDNWMSVDAFTGDIKGCVE